MALASAMAVIAAITAVAGAEKSECQSVGGALLQSVWMLNCPLI